MHEGILPSHLIFFLRHISQACISSALSHHSPSCIHPCYAPSLWVALVVVVVQVILGEHVLRQLRGIELATAKDARRRRVHHWLRRAIVAVRRGVHGGAELRIRWGGKVSVAPAAWLWGVVVFSGTGRARGWRNLGLDQLKPCRVAHQQGLWKCRRRPAGGRIASSSARVRQKLVWGPAVMRAVGSDRTKGRRFGRRSNFDWQSIHKNKKNSSNDVGERGGLRAYSRPELSFSAWKIIDDAHPLFARGAAADFKCG